MISFDGDVCKNFGLAIQKEWLETNGLGGYASSTITGANTRGYHGLLVASTNPPLQRMLLLSKVEEILILGGKRYEISCNQYPGTVYPEGQKYLDGFRLDPFPTFRYIADDIIIEKSVFVLHGENTVFVSYKLLESPQNVIIELRPLMACRNFHWRMHENQNPEIKVFADDDSIKMDMNDLEIYLLLRGGQFRRIPYWYRNFEYQVEKQRGQESHEDLYSPGCFYYEMNQEDEICLIASTHDPHRLDLEGSRSNELNRRLEFAEHSMLDKIPDSLKACAISLLASADQFIVKRGENQSIIAGYHWFGDWGRDSMIALTGLTLVTGRHEIAENILMNYVEYCDQGMIPNNYPEFDEKPQYNSVDASLWFIYAVKKYLDYTGNLLFVESGLYKTITEIIWNYREGTRYNIHDDSDGLLYAGEEGTQLTWMDAKVGDKVFTPRIGKPVEVNALWYNAIKFMGWLDKKLGHKDTIYSEFAEKIKQSFNSKFWNDEKGCLYDCINDDGVDASIRPNQIFAISLPYRLLNDGKAKSILNVVESELLTPYGLRTLSPEDKNYVGVYNGDRFSRDSAYHQGTVWAWLLGPFIDAYFNVYGRNSKTLMFIRKMLCDFSQKHLSDAGLNSISEIFDGDEPHNPGGCIAQAWSVAEILRAIVENKL